MPVITIAGNEGISIDFQRNIWEENGEKCDKLHSF